MTRWIALCMMLAAPVAAQDLQFSMDETLACLDAAAPGAARDCIGASAGACMEATPMGGTTVGMGGCLDRELGYWDDRLNAAFQRLLAIERREDAETVGQPGAASQADALRAMQRAWIGFRDATCDYERAQWGGGTGGGPATLACLMRLTGRQALYLDAAAAEG